MGNIFFGKKKRKNGEYWSTCLLEMDRLSMSELEHNFVPVRTRPGWEESAATHPVFSQTHQNANFALHFLQVFVTYLNYSIFYFIFFEGKGIRLIKPDNLSFPSLFGRMRFYDHLISLSKI